MMIVIFDVKPPPGRFDRQREPPVKVTKEKVAAHRAAIVAAAARLFRERGFAGVGVAEIMQAAGLTHGGFYGHFASKEALAAEACGLAFAESLARLPPPDRAVDALAAYLDAYLSALHRDHAEAGCPMPALATEIARQAEPLQTTFGRGVAAFVDALTARLPGGDAAECRARAIATLAAMVGAMALARATAVSAPALSAEILAATQAQLHRLTAAGAAQAADLP